jgi:ABC-type enterochelin transport system substrate-binding protein
MCVYKEKKKKNYCGTTKQEQTRLGPIYLTEKRAKENVLRYESSVYMGSEIMAKQEKQKESHTYI